MNTLKWAVKYEGADSAVVYCFRTEAGREQFLQENTGYIRSNTFHAISTLRAKDRTSRLIEVYDR